MLNKYPVPIPFGTIVAVGGADRQRHTEIGGEEIGVTSSKDSIVRSFKRRASPERSERLSG